MKTLALILSVFMVGCASSPGNISGSYVSPLQYQSYSCEQISQEMRRVGRKVQEVSGGQSSKATGDAVAMTVGLVIFWPALFFLASGDRGEELARLKGEAEALEQAAIQKNCKGLLEQIERERKEIEKRKKASEAEELGEDT